MSMPTTNQPDITYIEDYIEDGQKATISLSNFYDTILVRNANRENHIYRTAMNDFFLKYRDQLTETIQFYSIPDSMFYKPKSVSMDLYGTTELWLALLRVNDFKSVADFHYNIIKVYSPSDLYELINIFFKRQGIR
jgi:hypothetical protein